jgi:hypothetical protein
MGKNKYMKIAMMQPTFLPWIGFFELIYKSDVFIFLDDFQFSVQSFHQRNRLFVNAKQVDWYTVPVFKSKSFKANLNCVLINDSVKWRKKMIVRVIQNYSKTPYFNEIFPLFESCILLNAESIAHLNINFITSIVRLFGWQRNFLFSSYYETMSVRSQRVLELLQLSNATQYYSAKGSWDYMSSEKIFPIEGVEILFQDFNLKSYSQSSSPLEFVPFLSVLDALFNIGPSETAELITNGTKHWATWFEMVDKNIESINNKVDVQ